ncbi:MAG: tRNA (guanosine(37)-N1)-methyltransferase TrmD [Candidatus Eremiobacterota bacterium]
MEFDVITLFPHMFDPVFNCSIMGRAREKELFKLRVHNLRDFTENRHRTVDDYPFGGGRGMVLKPDPIWSSVEYIRSNFKKEKRKVLLMSPAGRVFNHNMAMELSQLEQMILICGHYEGVDERVIEYLVDDEISIGDYVLSGGELPAMVIIETIVRLIPGVIPDESVQTDSFYSSILSFPQYTRPRNFKGYEVPDVLISGHHEAVRKWRRTKAIEKTLVCRPELLNNLELTDEDKKIIVEINERQVLN